MRRGFPDQSGGHIALAFPVAHQQKLHHAHRSGCSRSCTQGSWLVHRYPLFRASAVVVATPRAGPFRKAHVTMGSACASRPASPWAAMCPSLWCPDAES